MTVTAAKRTRPPKPAAPARAATPWNAAERSAMRTLEMVFFAHMEQADVADQVLAEHDLGRPHHRVLYFAARKPGIAVGELTALLRVSNQALARTTGQLTAQGLLEQRYGVEDRRVRHNFATPAGIALLRELTGRQIAMIARAHEQLAPADLEGMWRGLAAMVRPQDMAWITTHPAVPPEDDIQATGAATAPRQRGTTR